MTFVCSKSKSRTTMCKKREVNLKPDPRSFGRKSKTSHNNNGDPQPSAVKKVRLSKELKISRTSAIEFLAQCTLLLTKPTALKKNRVTRDDIARVIRFFGPSCLTSEKLDERLSLPSYLPRTIY